MSNVAEPRRRSSATPPPRRRPGRAARRPSVRVRRRRAVMAVTIGGLALIGLLFAFVFPIRTYLAQRGQISSASAHLAQLQRDTRQVEAQSRQLRGDAAVERIAREEYGLVRPGETPYVLVPAASSPTTPTAATPTTTSPSGGGP
jgi:cell division protein FtsB